MFTVDKHRLQGFHDLNPRNPYNPRLIQSYNCDIFTGEGVQMRKISYSLLGLLIPAILLAQAPAPPAPAPVLAPSLPASYVIDLMTSEGSAAFGAQWKTMEAKIVDAKPIPEALPEYRTAYDIQPHAGESGYDDSKWPTIEAKDLSVRRSGGHVAFIWYRSNLTIPAKVGNFETAGSTAVLTVLVDDYA